MEVIAHRGDSAHHEENSLAAFKAAIQAGADGVEVDLRRSADGVIFCFHDHKLSRLTGGNGYFRRTSGAAIDKLQLRDGSRIPRFSEFLREIPPKARIILDIKSARIETDIVAELGERAIDSRLVFSSFNQNILKRVREQLPQANTALIVGPARNLQMRLKMKSSLARRLKRLNCQAVHLSKLLVSQGLVEHLRKEGLRISVWTVDDPKQALKIARLGVDSLMTNDPATIIAALESE